MVPNNGYVITHANLKHGSPTFKNQPYGSRLQYHKFWLSNILPALPFASMTVIHGLGGGGGGGGGGDYRCFITHSMVYHARGYHQYLPFVSLLPYTYNDIISCRQAFITCINMCTEYTRQCGK